MQFKENFVLFGFCNTNSRFQEVLKLIKTKLIMTWSLLFSLKISSWRVCVCMGGGVFSLLWTFIGSLWWFHLLWLAFMVTSVLVTWHSIIMCSNLFHVLSYTGFDCFIFNLPPFFYSLFQCLFFLVSSSTWDSQPLGDCRLVPTCAYWLNVLGDAWSSGCLLLREPEDMDDSGILMNCWENVNSAVI